MSEKLVHFTWDRSAIELRIVSETFDHRVAHFYTRFVQARTRSLIRHDNKIRICERKETRIVSKRDKSRCYKSRTLVRYESRVHASRFPSRAMLLGEHEVLLCTLAHCSVVEASKYPRRVFAVRATPRQKESRNFASG